MVKTTKQRFTDALHDTDRTRRFWRFETVFATLDAANAAALGGAAVRLSPYAGHRYTWGLHLTFTARMVTREQPDLRQNGTFFSLVFIYFINLILILGLFVLAAPGPGIDDLMDVWLDHLRGFAGWIAALP